MFNAFELDVWDLDPELAYEERLLFALDNIPTARDEQRVRRHKALNKTRNTSR